jgi:hypothetical protein
MTLKKKNYSRKKNSINILDIPYEILRDEITSFLTIYENFQLLFVFKNIDINWIYLQKRDYKFSIYFKPNKYNAIHLDNGNYLINKRDLITKTDAMNKYKLSIKDMDKIEPDLIKNNPKGFRNCMKLYDHRKIIGICASKYFGMTNFKFKVEFLKKKKEDKRRKFDNFILQKERDNKNYYKNMNTHQRKILLDQEFNNCGFNINRREDSQLCNKFISGEILTKSVDEIVSIMIITKLLFNKGGYTYYISKHEKFDNDLQRIKFNNSELSWYDCIYKINI